MNRLRPGLALLIAAACLPAAPALRAGQAARPADVVKAVMDGVASGALAYRLAEPGEVRALLGAPDREETTQDGGMTVLAWTYGGVSVVFGKIRDRKDPFTLREVRAGDRDVDIGRDRPLRLRTPADLEKMDEFSGLQGVSLERLDLRDRIADLRRFPFDTRTVWPAAGLLPAGFAPAEVLEAGRNPGLGVRALHAEGVDGRGVRVAVIDQPLIPDHVEYAGALDRYETIDVDGVGPQMHGPAVLSIAVGRTCGVAPGAKADFFAVPMWKSDDAAYAEALRRILRRNAAHPDDRVRAVSISTGMFERFAGFEDWRKVREEAARSGVFVIACDGLVVKYGTLARLPGGPADDPRSYGRGRFTPGDPAVSVPSDGRTTASPEGRDVYTFHPVGGMSWGAPYLAGLAALAFQVDPSLSPDAVATLLVETATDAPAAGKVVDPRAFIARVRARGR